MQEMREMQAVGITAAGGPQGFRSRPVDLKRVGAQPEQAVWQSWTDAYGTDLAEVQAYQLAALRTRFHQMVGRLPVLASLAAGQSLDDIRSLEEGALLLFRHSVYKSYPLSFIERAAFDRVTKWLDTFTLHDLSGFDAAGLDSIDAWLQRLDAMTPMRISHTNGTSGKLSFLPRSTVEMPLALRGWHQNFAAFGAEPERLPQQGLGSLPMIFPGYRHGALSANRLLDAFAETLYDGNEDMILTLHRERLSADLVSFSGRFASAEARGELGRQQLSPTLLAMVETARLRQADAPRRMREFIATIVDRLRGQRVMFFGYWSMLVDLATECRNLGVRRLFHPESLVWCSGGTKGKVFPPDFKQSTADTLGVRIQEGYGMSETVTTQPGCPVGNYHLAPYLIAYLLDPQTGRPSPRAGTHTGRLGVMDLLAMTYWGGILTGDEVTICFGDDAPCACGRKGPYMHPEIRRYSEQEGGDDKIACAGAPQALDRALNFLKDL
jgi:hypothetical protein